MNPSPSTAERPTTGPGLNGNRWPNLNVSPAPEVDVPGEQRRGVYESVIDFMTHRGADLMLLLLTLDVLMLCYLALRR